MAEKLMEGKVCPNHPETQAVTRCTTCFKPLCDDCRVEKGGLDFCSDQCATNHFTTNAYIEDGLEREKARKRRARIRRMILLLLLMFLVFGFIIYWREFMSSDQRKSLKDRARSGGSELLEKGRKLKDTVDK